MLTCTDINAAYGTAPILRGIDLTVDEGEVVGMLGRNGMGKTTLVRTIAGLSPPRLTSGRVTLAGDDVTRLPSFKISQHGVGLVPQGRHIFGSLTVEENLTVAARPGAGDGEGKHDWTLDRIYEFFPQLGDRRPQRGASLSGGEQQMLAIGRALMTNPRVLLMDEPSEGLAPVVLKVIREHLMQLKEEGLAIFLVEQNLGLALRLCDRIYVLGEGGRIAWEGTPAELDAETDVKRVHLGV
jgi:branched-chain amino acid transport system ATP-binding protein